MSRTLTLSTLTLMVGLTAPAARAADDGAELDTLAERLIELRGEVEDLHARLESVRGDHRNRMSTLAQRRASLENDVQSKQLQLRQIERAIEEQREKIKARNASAEALTPAVEAAASTLLAYVEGTLPFHTEERAAAIRALPEKMKKGEITAPRALNRLWGLVQDELRIAKESGLFRQEIELDGEAQLADVIRLGAMMLFFRTSGGELGFVQGGPGRWTYAEASGPAAERIANLFLSFEKQVRTGFFEIPNALTETAR